MVRFAEVFPDVNILHALRAKLSLTHLRQIIALDDPLQRDFYAVMRRCGPRLPMVGPYP
jgi:hypothetical protein